jgi:hypothetical protein
MLKKAEDPAGSYIFFRLRRTIIHKAGSEDSGILRSTLSRSFLFAKTAAAAIHRVTKNRI